MDLGTAFGVGHQVRLEQVGRGAMGAIWRLTTDQGVFAAKEPFWRPPLEADVRAEVAFRNACVEAGVPCPTPLAAPSGEYVVESWRLFEWIDGAVPDRSDITATRWLATQMGRIHQLGWRSGEDADREPWYHVVDVDWPALAAKAAAHSFGWAHELTDLSARLASLTTLVNEAPVDEQVWCHRDITNTNVLRGPRATWLVDWDNVGPMAPWRELGAFLVGLLGDEGNYRRVLTAYRQAGGTATVEGPSTFATGIAIWLNFLHGQVSAACDVELPQEHRHFAEQKVTALLKAIAGLPSWDQVRW